MTRLLPGMRRTKATAFLSAIAIVFGIALLLLPSGTFAWQYRAMSQLGAYHDDAVYWTSALSLSRGQGYTIPHLPERPAQTKYPPLYPALLSLIWRFSDSFPQNLKLLAALQWCFVPITLAMGWLYFRKCRFSVFEAYGMVLVVAMGPMTAIFATAPMTELPFTAMVLAVLFLIEYQEELAVRRAFFAGLLAAVAFLIRTNGIAFAASVPFLLLLRRRYRPAVAFVVPLFAAIAGWLGWCAVHAYPSRDMVLSYYTSYLGFYIQNFTWASLPLRIWINADAMIEGLPRLILFSTEQDVMWMRVAGWVMTAAATAGTVTLFRRGLRHYPILAVLFLAMLLFWEYPPEQRFLFPLLPLYIAGLVTKFTEVGKMAVAAWRMGPRANCVAAVVMLSVITLFAVGSPAAMAYGLTRSLPAYFEGCRQEKEQMQPVYRWIAVHTGAEERFAAYDDAILYLSTGRTGYTVPILPPLVYANDPEAVSQYLLSLPGLWRAEQVTYVLLTRGDFRRDFHEPAKATLSRMVQDRSRFQPLYADGTAQVYRLMDEPQVLSSR